jgi:hypothetical protein
MNCHVFRKGLSQIAAFREEPMGTTREHLSSCPSCRAALRRERILFRSIDAAFHASVNCELPNELLQRIRLAPRLESAGLRNLRGQSLRGKRIKGKSSIETTKNR